METKITENFSLSAYHVRIECDENISEQLNSDTCVVITDTLDGTSKTIGYDDLIGRCGLTKTTNDDYTQWFEDSFINNNGIVFNVNENVIEMKQLTKCYDSTSSNTIGYNPSKIDIYINGIKGNPITVKSRFSPYINRTLPYNFIPEDEEILYMETPTNYDIRRDFNYDNYQKIIEWEKLVNKNFNYNTEGSLYVNNRTGNSKGKSLTKSPLYVSDISAFSASWVTHSTAEGYDIESYIYNDTDDSRKDIPYEEFDDGQQGFIEIKPFGNYVSKLYYGAYRQFLTQPEGVHAENELVFEVKVKNKEIDPPPPPEPEATIKFIENKNVQCSMNFDKSKWGSDTWDDYGNNPNLSESLCWYYNDTDESKIDFTKAPAANDSESLTKPINPNDNQKDLGYPIRLENHNHIITRTWTSETEYNEERGEIRVTIFNPNKQGLVDFEYDGTTYKVFYQYKDADDNVAYLESADETVTIDGIVYERTIDVWCYKNPRTAADITNMTIAANNAEYVSASLDTAKYVSNGYINFNLNKIIIPKTAEYIDAWLVFDLGYKKSWDSITSDKHHWTLNNKPFIPKEYEDLFSKYVLYTPSFLYLKGSYVGAKSIYCTGIYAWNNSELDCEVIIGGEGEKYTEGNYNVILMGLNMCDTSKTWYDGTQMKNYWKDGLQPISSSEHIEIDDGDGHRLYANPECPTKVLLNSKSTKTTTYQIKADSNNSVLQSINFTDGKKPDLPVENIDYKKSTPETELKDKEVRTFDAKGGILDCGSITGGNNCTLVFEPGEYHFNGEFKFDTCCNIRINDCTQSTGMKYVRIYAKKFSFRNGLNIYNNSGIKDVMSLWLYSESTFTVAANNDRSKEETLENNIGVIIAQEEIHVMQNFYWKGALWSKLLKIEDNCQFISYDGGN